MNILLFLLKRGGIKQAGIFNNVVIAGKKAILTQIMEIMVKKEGVAVSQNIKNELMLLC